MDRCTKGFNYEGGCSICVSFLLPIRHISKLKFRRPGAKKTEKNASMTMTRCGAERTLLQSIHHRSLIRQMLPQMLLAAKRSLTFLRRISCIPKPIPSSLSLLADRCNSMSQLKQIHAKMIINACIHDNYAASRLIAFSALADTGDINYAFKLFHSIQEPNSFMWNTLIRALATSLYPQQALLLYVQMRRLCITPGAALSLVV